MSVPSQGKLLHFLDSSFLSLLDRQGSQSQQAWAAWLWLQAGEDTLEPGVVTVIYRCTMAAQSPVLMAYSSFRQHPEN